MDQNPLKKLLLKNNIGHLIKDIKNSLLKDCIAQKHKILNVENGCNYHLQSNHTNFLYNIFYQTSKKYLKDFNLSDVDFQLWCYFTDNNFSKSVWHNHSNTSSINCVIYLKTAEKGIYFKFKNKEIYLLPKEDDMLIFPSFLDHFPVKSEKEPRITLNLELRCKEPTEKIFNL